MQRGSVMLPIDGQLLEGGTESVHYLVRGHIVVEDRVPPGSFVRRIANQVVARVPAMRSFQLAFV